MQCPLNHILLFHQYLNRTQFKIPQGVNAFDYSERINLIGKLCSVVLPVQSTVNNRLFGTHGIF